MFTCQFVVQNKLARKWGMKEAHPFINFISNCFLFYFFESIASKWLMAEISANSQVQGLEQWLSCTVVAGTCSMHPFSKELLMRPLVLAYHKIVIFINLQETSGNYEVYLQAWSILLQCAPSTNKMFLPNQKLNHGINSFYGWDVRKRVLLDILIHILNGGVNMIIKKKKLYKKQLTNKKK